MGKQIIKVLESLARGINHVLFTLFVTSWAVIYFFAYWRRPVFISLIVFAFICDLARLSRPFCQKVNLSLQPRWLMLTACLVVIVASQTLVVFLVPQLSFESPFLHFERATRLASIGYARFIYVAEASGAALAFALVIFNAFRQSAGEYPFRRVVPPPSAAQRAALSLILLIALMSLAPLLLDWGRSPLDPFVSYDPVASVLLLLMYSAVPLFFTGAHKVFLQAAYVSLHESLPATANRFH